MIFLYLKAKKAERKKSQSQHYNTEARKKREAVMSSAIKTVCFGSTEAHREVSQLTVAKENPRNSLTENHL